MKAAAEKEVEEDGWHLLKNVAAALAAGTAAGVVRLTAS
jgi:hypothetical protein